MDWKLGNGFQMIQANSFIAHFISNLMPPLILQEVPVCGPEVGDPCSRVSRGRGWVGGAQIAQHSLYLWALFMKSLCFLIPPALIFFFFSFCPSSESKPDLWSPSIFYSFSLHLLGKLAALEPLPADAAPRPQFHFKQSDWNKLENYLSSHLCPPTNFRLGSCLRCYLWDNSGLKCFI